MTDIPDDWERMRAGPAFTSVAEAADRLAAWSLEVPLVLPAEWDVPPFKVPPWVNAFLGWPRKPGALRYQLVERTLRRAGRDPQWAEALSAAYALGGLCGVRDLAASEITPKLKWRKT